MSAGWARERGRAPGYRLGAVRKGDRQDQARLLGCRNAAVKRSGSAGEGPWRRLWDRREALQT
jgi:hypothetical protein